jgi:hypothetical protein
LPPQRRAGTGKDELRIARQAVVAGSRHLWGIAVSTAVNALLYLLIGEWTQSASCSFQKIVTTQSSDIRRLMDALASLHKMYTLFYTRIVVGLLFLIAAVGQYIYAHVAR